MIGQEIGVIGAGTWGVALARMLSNAGHEETVWSALPAEIDELDKTRRQKNLPNMEIPDEVIFTKDLEKACRGKDILLFAVPSVFVRLTAKKAAALVPDNQILVDVAKGIEPSTLMTMSEVIASEIPRYHKQRLSPFPVQLMQKKWRKTCPQQLLLHMWI